MQRNAPKSGCRRLPSTAGLTVLMRPCPCRSLLCALDLPVIAVYNVIFRFSGIVLCVSTHIRSRLALTLGVDRIREAFDRLPKDRF